MQLLKLPKSMRNISSINKLSFSFFDQHSYILQGHFGHFFHTYLLCCYFINYDWNIPGRIYHPLKYIPQFNKNILLLHNMSIIPYWLNTKATSFLGPSVLRFLLLNDFFWLYCELRSILSSTTLKAVYNSLPMLKLWQLY